MQILSKGFFKPETGDRGALFFPRLEDNFQQLNDHTHDGSNSEKINAFNIQKSIQTIDSADWGADLGGSTYKQTITVPAGVDLTNDRITFKILGGADDGCYLMTSPKVLSATSYEVTINDNTIGLTAIYG